jgi:O-antigen/teichoic acid export membrane protein
MIYEVLWIVSAVSGAICTYWLQTRWKVRPVSASSVVTLLIALAVLPFSDSSQGMQAIPYAGIGGSFIGMSTKKNVKGFETVLLAALIFGLIFIHSSQFFEGFGGALGTSACISVLTAISWRKFFKRVRSKTKRKMSRITR